MQINKQIGNVFTVTKKLLNMENKSPPKRYSTRGRCNDAPHNFLARTIFLFFLKTSILSINILVGFARVNPFLKLKLYLL